MRKSLSSRRKTSAFGAACALIALVVGYLWPSSSEPAARPADAAVSAPRGEAPASPRVSPPENASSVGFASRQGWLDHYAKHGAEFGDITREQYLSAAQAVRDARAGGDILEARRRDGTISRYDRKTGAFLAFNLDGTIRTFFKPDDGERYFQRQIDREH